MRSYGYHRPDDCDQDYDDVDGRSSIGLKFELDSSKNRVGYDIDYKG